MESTDLLFDEWYVAAPASQLRRGKMLPVKLLGQQVLLLRDNAGVVSAIRDFCPHRGMPLRYGKFDGCEVECCYHGWKFNPEGVCTSVPSLIEAKTDIAKIKTGRFPCIEQDGLIWVYVHTQALAGEPPLPPTMPAPIPGGFRVVDSVIFPCYIDHAVIGLMDPAHGPYVHRSWWWRTQRSMHEKSKKFAPFSQGFKMVRHAPSKNSFAYKILGGAPSTEIAFQLPGLRTEHITIGERYVVLLTALTPIDEQNTQLHQFMYTNIKLLNLLRPLLLPFGKKFIGQDLTVVKMQQEGLAADHPPLMLLGDADAQALWYYRLKKEALSAKEEGRSFENPLKERVLKWRS